VVVGVGTTWDAQVPVVNTGSDLLTDGAFENWTADDLDSWTETTCDASEDIAGETGSAAEVTTSADNGTISQTIVTVAETWYTLRGYYKNTGGDTAIFGVYDNTGGGFITPYPQNSGYVELSDNAAFTSFDYIFKTPASCVSVDISLGGKTNGDIVWFDTCTVYEIAASSTTWDNLNASTATWTNIFALDQGPSVEMRLYYGPTSPPTNYLDKMEILSGIVTDARYFRVRITITDPTAEIYAYVEEYFLRLCQ
jgi:hypothetical protein